MAKTFRELICEKDFMKKLIAQQTEEDAKKLFVDEGVSMTDAEMEALRKILERSLEGKELSEEDLEEIVGAGAGRKIVGEVVGAGVATLVGGIPGLAGFIGSQVGGWVVNKISKNKDKKD